MQTDRKNYHTYAETDIKRKHITVMPNKKKVTQKRFKKKKKVDKKGFLV